MSNYDEASLMENQRLMNESEILTVETVKNIIKHLQKNHVFDSPISMTVEVCLNKSQLLLQGYQHDIEIYLRGEKQHLLTIMKLELDDYPEIMQSMPDIPDIFIDDLILGILTDPYSTQLLLYADNSKIVRTFEIELSETIKHNSHIKVTRLNK